MLQDPLTDEATVRRVAASFETTELRVVSVIPSGQRNDNFLVEDAGRRRYALRRYRRNRDRDRIIFQAMFQSFAHSQGLPVARIVSTRLGAPLLDDSSGTWMLCAYVDGADYRFDSMPQVAGAAATLADFHRLTRTFPHAEVVGRGNPNVRRWWTHGTILLEELDLLFVDRSVDAEIRFLHRWHAELVREWPLERLDSLPAAWVHGDFHGRNVTFSGDAVRGIFDFDLVHFGFAVEDVGDALFRFGRARRGSTRLRPGAAGAFLDGYKRSRTLTEEERSAIGIMASLAMARDRSYYDLLAADERDPVPFLKEKVHLMRTRREQWHKHAGSILASLTNRTA